MALGKALVVIGGTVVTAGAIWWLSQQKLKPKCDDYHTESECVAHGCYWWGGACHVAPESPPDYHYACIKDPTTGFIMCSLVEGAGTDLCDPYAPDACWAQIPCSSDIDCGTGAGCWEGQCYWKANVPYQEHLDWEGTREVSVSFEFEKRVIGNQFMGSIEFNLAPWNVGCDPHIRIYLIRNGQRVRTVYDQFQSGVPTTLGDPHIRTDPITFGMAAEAIDGIEVWCKCERGFPWHTWSAVMTKVHCQYLFI